MIPLLRWTGGNVLVLLGAETTRGSEVPKNRVPGRWNERMASVQAGVVVACGLQGRCVLFAPSLIEMSREARNVENRRPLIVSEGYSSRSSYLASVKRQPCVSTVQTTGHGDWHPQRSTWKAIGRAPRRLWGRPSLDCIEPFGGHATARPALPTSQTLCVVTPARSSDVPYSDPDKRDLELQE